MGQDRPRARRRTSCAPKTKPSEAPRDINLARVFRAPSPPTRFRAWVMFAVPLATVRVRFDVDNGLIRLLLAFFFFVFHQFFCWVMARALLGQQLAFDLQRTLLIGLLNAIVGVSLFHFLDKVRETA
jgi:hypothetical protein